MSIQLRISRAQHDKTRLGRVFPTEQDHNAQATLKRLVPHHGGIQGQMRFLWPRAEILETVQGLEVDLPIIFAPCPASLRVRTGVEKHAVGIAPLILIEAPSSAYRRGMLVVGEWSRRRGGDLRRFYTKQHKMYCGIDLQARTLSICILSQEGGGHGPPAFHSQPRDLPQGPRAVS